MAKRDVVIRISAEDMASGVISRIRGNFVEMAGAVASGEAIYNGITGAYILTIEGRCSLGNNDTAQRMSVTCKTGPNEYKRHFLGISDNVTFFAEQIASSPASIYRYRVRFNPAAVVPDIDFP